MTANCRLLPRTVSVIWMTHYYGFDTIDSHLQLNMGKVHTYQLILIKYIYTYNILFTYYYHVIIMNNI